MSDLKELRIGVLGAGGRGMVANYAHKPDEGSCICAGADVDPNALINFKEKYGSEVFVTNDYRKLLDEADVNTVFVASPDYLHEEHAIAALKKGNAVYLEKPMAITIEGCDRILNAAIENNSRLYLGHNMRHMDFVLKMKELINAGAIGEVKAGWCRHFISYGCDAYFKDWHADRSKTTSLLLQKAAHDIDVLHWLCGSYTKRVTAMGNLSVYNRIIDRHPATERGDASWHLENWPPLNNKQLNPVIDVEDHSMMLMELENGALCSYHQCHYTPDAWRNYTIIGTEGRIENFGDQPGNCIVRLWNRRTYYKPEGDEEYVINPAEGGHGGADPRIVEEFVHFARNGGRTSTSPIAARNSVATGVKATESLRDGGIPKEIPSLPPEVISNWED